MAEHFTQEEVTLLEHVFAIDELFHADGCKLSIASIQVAVERATEGRLDGLLLELGMISLAVEEVDKARKVGVS